MKKKNSCSMETPLVAVCDKGSLVHANRKAKVLANSYIRTSSLFLLGAFSAPATKMGPLVHCCSNDRARPGLARVPTDARYEDFTVAHAKKRYASKGAPFSWYV